MWWASAMSGSSSAAVLTDHTAIDYQKVVEQVPVVYDSRGVYRKLGLGGARRLSPCDRASLRPPGTAGGSQRLHLLRGPSVSRTVLADNANRVFPQRREPASFVPQPVGCEYRDLDAAGRLGEVIASGGRLRHWLDDNHPDRSGEWPPPAAEHSCGPSIRPI